MVKALWRELEEMTPEQRGAMLLPEGIGVGQQVDGQMMWTCEHTPVYLRARRSFEHSPQWKQFRQEFLEEHPVCARCGKKATVVHHRDNYTVDVTLIAWGFQWIFKRPECCQALCAECHYAGHERLIQAEAPGKADMVHRLGNWVSGLLRRDRS